MIDKWKNLYESNEAAFIIFALITLVGVIAYIKRWLENRSNPEPAPTSTYAASQGGVIQTGDGTNAANIGSGTINIGITATEFADELKHREIEIRAELEQKHGKDNTVLEAELRDIQQQSQDVTASYEARITSLKERIAQLEAVRGEYPDALLDEAITALQQGDSKQADALFKQIEEENENTIKLVAEAAYQRGKIAQDTVRYLDVLNHYEKAVRLAPNNSLYLNEAGLINQKLAYFKKAIGYHEQALASDLKTYGEDHPDVATDRNNLGMAWQALGEYQKAIGYLEQALGSVFKTYGEAHPDVAIDRNNLGGALGSLGEYQKAINYYEQALAGGLKTYGEDHPLVATARNNLGMAWQALGEYPKAIGYYEQALDSDLKTYGEAHPAVAICRNNLGMAWNTLGEYQKAIGYYEQALVTLERKLEKTHPHTQTVQRNLEKAQAKMADSVNK